MQKELHHSRELYGPLFRPPILISQFWQAPGWGPHSTSDHSNCTFTWRGNKAQKPHVTVRRRVLVLCLSLFLISLSSPPFFILLPPTFSFFLPLLSLFICWGREIIIIV